jgi:isochorismate hydrolase
MKKDEYFTDQTLIHKSKEFLELVVHYQQRHLRQKFKPNRAVLLVLDMQDFFLEPDSHAYVPSAPSILPGIQGLIKLFSAIGQPVIYTRHVNTEADAGMMSIWWGDIINPNFARSHISEMFDIKNQLIIEKTQYDAFLETSLDKTLRKRRAEQVVVTGVMTHLCCETTARSAFMRGYEVFFPVDGTATYTEAHHRASLLNLSHGFALPLLVDDIKSYF